MLASGVRDTYDTAHGENNKDVGRAENSQDDGQSLPESYCTHRRHVQLVAHLRQFDVPILERCFHSDA